MLAVAPATSEAPRTVQLDRAGVVSTAAVLSEQGRLEEALALLDGMTPDDRASADVRFARAVLLIDLGRAAEAEGLLEKLVIEKPNVTRIRLEHGRALAAIGHYGTAERQLRRALADDPPPAVIASVDTALRGIRAQRRVFGSFGAGIAPDTNINSATSAETVDLFGLPFELDPSARRKSGIGLVAIGEIGLRKPVSPKTALVGRLNGTARIYPNADTDDIAVELRGGVEHLGRTGRITPEFTYLRRWYAGQAYAEGIGGGLRIERRLGSAWFGSAILDVRHLDYDRSRAYDGWVASARLQADRALGAATVLSLGGTATRTTARDNGYASWLGEVDAALFRDWSGGWATSVSAGVGHLSADAPIAALGETRRDWRLRGSVSVANRKLSWLGMMPTVRLSTERIQSSIDLYDLSRTRLEFLLTRTF